MKPSSSQHLSIIKVLVESNSKERRSKRDLRHGHPLQKSSPASTSGLMCPVERDCNALRYGLDEQLDYLPIFGARTAFPNNSRGNEIQRDQSARQDSFPNTQSYVPSIKFLPSRLAEELSYRREAHRGDDLSIMNLLGTIPIRA